MEVHQLAAQARAHRAGHWQDEQERRGAGDHRPYCGNPGHGGRAGMADAVWLRRRSARSTESQWAAGYATRTRRWNDSAGTCDPMKFNRPKKNRGIALIIVMCVIVMFSILAAGLAY